MSTVRIPPTLRTATGGEKRVEVDGATVRDGRRPPWSPPIPASKPSSSARTATSTRS